MRMLTPNAQCPDLQRLLTETEWMMQPGERAAIDGLLAAIQPGVSIEVGTHAGGASSPSAPAATGSTRSTSTVTQT